ncbi:MAG: pantetheine-phosphate adenylyltransferase [Candidatus Thorarchaeota archaeon]|nr:pantetheine-phosphate adenylyltransferase [Candidatus Thorarchaeota archaeon]
MPEKQYWPYKRVIFAGTFDHLHEGHKYLLRTALRLGAQVGIGITTDEMLRGKAQRKKIQTYKEREEALREFLQDERAIERCAIFPIDTVEGGADKMEDIDALIVSDEIKVVENAFKINDLRFRNGLKRFHIVVIPRVRSHDGRPLSSSRIRDGEEFDKRELIY